MGLFSLYLAHNERVGLIYHTPDLSFDRAYLEAVLGLHVLIPLCEPLPVGICAYLLTGLQGRLARLAADQQRRVGDRPFEELARLCRRQLRSLACGLRFGALKTWPSDNQAPESSRSSGRINPGLPVSFPSKEELEELRRLLDGRLLRPAEIARILGLGGGTGARRLEWVIQALCLAGRAGLLPALLPLRGSLVRCQRCGWEGIARPVSCCGCGRADCCECPECAVMGGLSLCEPLYTAAPAGEAAEATCRSRGPEAGRGLFSGIVGLSRPTRVPHPEGGGWGAALPGYGRSAACHPLYITSDGTVLSRLPWPRVEAGDGAVASPAGSPRGRRRRHSQSAGFHLEVEFTPPQQAVVDLLLEFGAGLRPDGCCLVWAACGAGKTEVSYPLIGQALGRGETVLFATPRRDVVLEVAPRLERAFGKERVVALYGGSGNRAKEAPLVVATTHQTLRWHRHFDLVILDEGDAFPYPGSRMLHYGVEQARRGGGRLVYLTATPASWMLDRIGQDEVDIIKIPARPHGFPLPEPRFLKLHPFRARNRQVAVHPEVLNLIKTIVEQFQARLFLFVPSVEQTALVGQALRAAAGKPPLENFQPSWFEWSHAGDQHRDRKRERFFNGEFPVLVTTTIMERGVTVPRVHVIVLWADQAAVFDTPTLVQIAGRCGRSPSYPTGEVWFLGPRVSREMEEALGQIRAMNAEAARLGYLRPDYLEALRELLGDEIKARPARQRS